MSIEDITNYKAVSETLASSGQPEEMQFKDIAQAGFEVVINLAMPNSDNAIPEEGYIVTARKMMYVHLPVPFEAPTVEHLKSFFALLEALEGKKCWVHCVVNYRVSAFMYQYFRLVHKVSAEDAKKVIIAEWKPDQVWREFMALDERDVGL
ncbi:MAG: protein tyrosine phosphatase family protein [Sedimenticola sp.]